MPAPVKRIVVKRKPPKTASTPSASTRAAARRTPALPTPPSISDSLSPEARAQLHKDRAKRWEAPSPWAAEWFENAVRFCQTAEGRAKFETWLRSQTPAEELPDILKAVNGPPVNRKGMSYHGNAQMWNSAAYELGVSDEALKQFHNFTAANNLCSPPRTLPAVKRRRGESSTDYLTRMHGSLLQGCKMPDIDWKDIRNIAIAQYDDTRATIEAWHQDMDLYNDVIKTRARTTVAVTSVLEMVKRSPFPERLLEMQLRTDAYRSCLFLIHLAHAVWSRAAECLEDLASRGLVTTSAIEREYRTDPRLKWRLISIGQLSKVYTQKTSARLSTIFARLPAFRNYIKSFRTDDGLLHLELNRAYIAAHPFQPNTIDEHIVYMCTKPTSSFHAYFQEMTNCLTKNPKEAEKFDSNAWDEIGTSCDINSFTVAFNHSSFGQALMDCANEPIPPGEQKIFMEEVCFFNPAVLEAEDFEHVSFAKSYGRAEKVTFDLINTWSNEIYDHEMQPAEFIHMSVIQDLEPHVFDPMPPEARHVVLVPPFDKGWMVIDIMLWSKAKAMDPPGRPGLVAKTFGLIDPHDVDNRPMYSKIIIKDIDRLDAKIRGKEYVEKPKVEEPEVHPVPRTRQYQPSFPVAGPGESAAQSGHAYVSSTGDSAKEKVKTRKEAGETENVEVSEVDEEDEEAELPDALPLDFKLPKKVWKMFTRLLDRDENSDDNSQKKGQVRWGDFEKGMRRVGFDVIQTAGSSVRFDPPAKNARPITFHRPHPDSLLTPHLLKWVGARLQRTYGWTTKTFQRKEDEEGPSAAEVLD
ncbi:hypothetical protein BDZ89DRAFT_1067890 [Hymenopellis radicata]|nr:hypothetical protein BDZ89DRAFT_1067890 [Hymenopellis radicata]